MNNIIYLINRLIKKYHNQKIINIFGYIYLITQLNNVCKLLKNYKYYVKKIPYVKNEIDNKTNKTIEDIKKGFSEELKGVNSYSILPDNGLDKDIIISEFDNMREKYTYDYKNGYVSGSVYSNNKTLDSLHNTLYLYFNKSNPLHTNIFPSVRLMENNLVSMMIKLFNGNNNVCGTFTSGGTESILLACKTYRDYYLENKDIKNPEIIASTTAHCAFNKACKYFNIKLILIPCNLDGTFDTQNLKKQINKNTILIVGSTPSYNLGIIDPIDKLSKIALENNIPLHIDACIGSFLVNFTDKNFDFRLEGVTSISADYHKYGNSPKGASCIMYNSNDLLKYQYYIDETWSGGIYASSTIAGSRPGNIVALTWATLLYYGKNKYLENYETIIELQKYLVEKINYMSDLYVIGDPELSIVAIDSETININILAEYLKRLKWDINVIQNPKGFHICITSYHTKEIIDKFILDIESIIPNIADNNDYSPCIYGTMQKIGDNDIIKDVVAKYLHVVNNVKLNI